MHPISSSGTYTVRFRPHKPAKRRVPDSFSPLPLCVLLYLLDRLVLGLLGLAGGLFFFWCLIRFLGL